MILVNDIRSSFGYQEDSIDSFVLEEGGGVVVKLVTCSYLAVRTVVAACMK
jgi:hypothetical protein